MPPNRFESEVESFLEGSHGDRTHIKRADHPRLHHYAGHYSLGPRHAEAKLLMLQNPHRSQPEVHRAASKTGAVPVVATKLAQHGPSSDSSAKKLALHARKRRF